MFFSRYDYDIIIIGGGHAGIEAAYVCSKMKCRTLLITLNKSNIGEISCNPSIGGLGKSHLVKEIDALGGLMGKLTDLSGIHFKTLNSSKGYSVRSTRVQVDKMLYKKYSFEFLLKQKYLSIHYDEVLDLIVKNDIVYGVKTFKNIIYSKVVILCTGTFLDAKIFIGNNKINGGRLFEKSSIKLSNSLKKYGLIFGYLKTGTPPRLNKNTILFDNLQKQYSDKKIISKFSFFNKLRNNKILDQIICFITYTNKKTHDIVNKYLYKSPLFNGLINSIGPRYCISLENKVYNFPFREKHNVFLEFEQLNNNLVYPNGLSMSFPLDIQEKIINSIDGLNNSKILIPGYSVEYMYLNPIFLCKSLESKIINNFFIAGQVNGTTGYEEAACQGLIAGINACLKIKKNNLYFNNFILSRLSSYIGVLIDDLCTKGVKEPYRIFNSRSEFSLFLREDNADYRLTELGYKLGLISYNKWCFFNKKINEIKLIYNYLDKKKFIFNKLPNFIKNKFKNNKNVVNIKSLICNSLIKFNKLKYFLFNKKKIFLKSNYLNEVKILFLYENYIKKQKIELYKYKLYENIILPKNIKYNKIIGLSNEVVQLLNYYKPNFLGQLLNISGITPISVIIIFIYLKKNNLLIKNKIY